MSTNCCDCSNKVFFPIKNPFDLSVEWKGVRATLIEDDEFVSGTIHDEEK